MFLQIPLKVTKYLGYFCKKCFGMTFQKANLVTPQVTENKKSRSQDSNRVSLVSELTTLPTTVPQKDKVVYLEKPKCSKHIFEHIF